MRSSVLITRIQAKSSPEKLVRQRLGDLRGCWTARLQIWQVLDSVRDPASKTMEATENKIQCALLASTHTIHMYTHAGALTCTSPDPIYPSPKHIHTKEQEQMKQPSYMVVLIQQSSQGGSRDAGLFFKRMQIEKLQS